MGAILLSTAFLGSSLSIGKLYAFHVVVAFLAAGIIFFKQRSSRFSMRTVACGIGIFAYLFLSLLWTQNYRVGLQYIFYLACGFFLILLIAECSSSLGKFKKLVDTLLVLLTLNILIGMLETLGFFRLPSSALYGTNIPRPTGFFFNINDFMFVFVVFLPFLIFHNSIYFRILGAVSSLWFLFLAGSKGYLLTLLVFGFFLLVTFWQKKWFLGVLVAGLAGFGLSLLMIPQEVIAEVFGRRAFRLIPEISKGIMVMIETGSSFGANEGSTSNRAHMYKFALSEMSESPLFGVGLSGVATAMADGTPHRFVSVHNFFLEMAADLGILVFSAFMFAYFSLIKLLLKSNKWSHDSRLNYYRRATACSLILCLPASISPSSIIYLLPFWVALSLGIGLFRILSIEVYRR